MAAVHGYKIHQMDAVATFLNSKLDNLIYMEQPEGYAVHGKEDYVCMLNRALYCQPLIPKPRTIGLQRYLHLLHLITQYQELYLL